MAGTIYLGGGGSAADEAQLWRAMLDDKRRVLYWPFALEPDLVSGAEGWLTRSLRDLDMDVQVETWTDLRQHDPEEIAGADLIFVGGGNTFQLLDHVRRHGYEQVVRDFVAAGGDFYGGSAGAILACSNIRIAGEHDTNDARLTDFKGLGLLRDLVVLPHYAEDQLTAAQRWSQDYGRPVLGIPERSGVVARGGVLEVVGFADVFVVTGSTVTIRQPGERWTPLPTFGSGAS